MKKITKVIALILAMIMVLSGCMYEKDTTTINSDGSVTFVSYAEIDKETMDTYLEGMGIVDPETYLNSQTEGATYNVIKKDDGKEYYVLEETEKYKNINKYAQAHAVDTQYTYVTNDTYYAVVDLTETLAEQAPGQDISTVFTIDYVFVFPQPIVSTTGTIDPENPNKVTFNINVTGKNKIFATTKEGVTLDATAKKVKAMYSVKRPVIKSLKTKKVTKKNASVTLKIKKIKGVKYFIEWATNKSFSNNYDCKITKKNKVVIKKLKPGKKYYFRVCAIKKTMYKTEVNSKNSKRKSIKIKKIKTKK